MKKKMAVLGVFGAGLFVGGLVMFVLMGVRASSIVQSYDHNALLELAVNARQIRAGQYDAVLQRYDNAIPRFTIQFHKQYKGLSSSPEILREVKRYYSDNPSLSVPDEVRDILDSLPPRR